MLKWMKFQLDKKQQQLKGYAAQQRYAEQQRYASPRTALAVVLIQNRCIIFIFRSAILDNAMWGWRVHHGNNRADTNRLPIVLARICPTVLFEFVPIMSSWDLWKKGGCIWAKTKPTPLLASFEWGRRTMKDAWRLHKISNTSGCNNSHRQTVYYLLNILIYALQSSN